MSKIIKTIFSPRNVFPEAVSLLLRIAWHWNYFLKKKSKKRWPKYLQMQRMILHILTDCSTPEWTDTTRGKMFAFIIWVDWPFKIHLLQLIFVKRFSLLRKNILLRTITLQFYTSVFPTSQAGRSPFNTSTGQVDRGVSRL